MPDNSVTSSSTCMQLSQDVVVQGSFCLYYDLTLLMLSEIHSQDDNLWVYCFEGSCDKTKCYIGKTKDIWP